MTKDAIRATLSLLTLLCPVATLAQAQAATQTTIPATATTRSVSDLPSAQPAAGVQTQHQSGQVTWDGSQLSVVAAGDDLRDILLQVARLTGMKITGSVPLERVFGTYGPGSAQKIVTELMDGSGVNMMLINATPVLPKELILTARAGGVTPPSTRSVSSADMQQSPTTYPPYQPHNMMPPPGTAGVAGQPANTQDNGGNAGIAQDGQGGAQPAPTDANGTPQSPNGTRTPEQIFEELRKRAQRSEQP